LNFWNKLNPLFRLMLAHQRLQHVLHCSVSLLYTSIRLWVSTPSSHHNCLLGPLLYHPTKKLQYEQKYNYMYGYNNYDEHGYLIIKFLSIYLIVQYVWLI